MHPQFALFDGSPGIPYGHHRVAIIRCTPTSDGDSHYTVQDVVPSDNQTRRVSSELSPTEPSMVAATIYVKWEGATASYQKLQWWDTGMLVNGSIPIIDCDFNEVFIPSECHYTIANDSSENCSRRMAYQNRLRKDMIDKIISRYIPHNLLGPYAPPLPMPPRPLPTNAHAPAFTSVTNRPATPIPSSAYVANSFYYAYHGDSDSESDYDEDDYNPQPVHMNASAPPQETQEIPPSQIPLFVANLIKNEAIAKNTSCPISMESFSDCKTCSLTSCYHLFERESLATWLSTKNTCPVCKQQVTATLVF